MIIKRKLLIMGGSYMNLQMKINPKTKCDSTTLGSEYFFHPAGDSAIAAVSAAKNGGDCIFATRFGDDINGKRLYDYYKNCGISKQLMRKDSEAQTGLCLTLFSDHFEHENFLTAGASTRFTKNEIDEAFASTSPDLFLLPLEELGQEEHMVVIPADQVPEQSLEEEFTHALMPSVMIETSEFSIVPPEDVPVSADEPKPEKKPEPASEKGKLISSETVSSYIEKESLAAYAAKKADDLGINLMVQYTPFTAQYPLEEMKSIKIFVISDEDLRDLTGFYPDNTEKALRALVMLSSKIQSKYYIIQRGDDSVFVYDGTHYEIVFAPEILRKDTREIGVKMKPSFIGALAAEYLDSKNIIRACRFAIIVSLLTRTKFGNLEKLMSRSELVQYVTERGIKLFG
jgi:sugar/nucleoside kinase (ribokinase family)